MIFNTMLFYRFSCSWEKEAFLTRLILPRSSYQNIQTAFTTLVFLHAIDLKEKGSLYFWPHMTIKKMFVTSLKFELKRPGLSSIL